MGRGLLSLVTLAVGGIRGLRRRVFHDVERSRFGIRLRGLLRRGVVGVGRCGRRQLLGVRLGRLVGRFLDVRSRFLDRFLDVRSRFLNRFLDVLVNRLLSFPCRFFGRLLGRLRDVRLRRCGVVVRLRLGGPGGGERCRLRVLVSRGSSILRGLGGGCDGVLVGRPRRGLRCSCHGRPGVGPGRGHGSGCLRVHGGGRSDGDGLGVGVHNGRTGVRRRLRGGGR